MTLQYTDTQKAARYVGTQTDKKATSAELEAMMSHFSGEITVLPGLASTPRPASAVKEDPDEFCGLVRLNRVKRWMNNGPFNRSQYSRRKLIMKHVPFSWSKILRIACPMNESMLTNREWRMIMDAIPLVEAEEQQIKRKMVQKFKGAVA